jgi:hypothetical protein
MIEPESPDYRGFLLFMGSLLFSVQVRPIPPDFRCDWCATGAHQKAIRVTAYARSHD